MGLKNSNKKKLSLGGVTTFFIDAERSDSLGQSTVVTSGIQALAVQ
jgi:hypothetical protein